jgi:hypothetical protein
MRGFEEGVSRSHIFAEDFAFFFDCFDDSGGEGVAVFWYRFGFDGSVFCVDQCVSECVNLFVDFGG